MSRTRRLTQRLATHAQKIATEAWMRFEADEVTDEELYPSDAAWCGIFDRMARAPSTQKTEHTTLTAALYGLPPAT